MKYQVKKSNSTILKSIQKLRDFIKNGTQWNVGDGQSIIFLNDT